MPLQVLLGNSQLKTTEVYAERNNSLALKDRSEKLMIRLE
jgi:hypothetical protein